MLARERVRKKAQRGLTGGAQIASGNPEAARDELAPETRGTQLERSVHHVNLSSGNRAAERNAAGTLRRGSVDRALGEPWHDVAARERRVLGGAVAVDEPRGRAGGAGPLDMGR